MTRAWAVKYFCTSLNVVMVNIHIWGCSENLGCYLKGCVSLLCPSENIHKCRPTVNGFGQNKHILMSLHYLPLETCDIGVLFIYFLELAGLILCNLWWRQNRFEPTKVWQNTDERLNTTICCLTDERSWFFKRKWLIPLAGRRLWHQLEFPSSLSEVSRCQHALLTHLQCYLSVCLSFFI